MKIWKNAGDYGVVVTDVTILTMEECKKYMSEIPNTSGTWWTRTPIEGHLSCNVVSNGHVHISASYMDEGMRPAIQIIPTSHLQVGDKIQLANLSWTVLDEEVALCDDIVDHVEFSMEQRNLDWDTSSLKMWLNLWANEYKIIGIH